jgi:hypothetical protein
MQFLGEKALAYACLSGNQDTDGAPGDALDNAPKTLHRPVG